MYEIFFASGNLPPTLQPEEEQKLLLQLANGSDEARKKLIEHNLRLVVFVAKKFENTGLDIHDCISIGTIGLIKGINSYSLEKNTKLATYTARCIENEILMFLRSNKKHIQVQSLEEALATDFDGHELTLEDVLEDENAEFENKIINKRYNAKILAAMKEILTEKEYTTIVYLYGFTGERKKQNDIASMLGISQSYVSRVEKRALNKLRQRLDVHISEIEDYQKKKAVFNIHKIHPELTLPILESLISLFPEKEKNLYTQYIKINSNPKRKEAKSFGEGVPSFADSEIEEIEIALFELFCYYKKVKEEGKIRIEAALQKTARYAEEHSLRFCYKEKTLEEIKMAVNGLSAKEKETVFAIYGNDFSLFHQTINNENIKEEVLRKIRRKLTYKLNRNIKVSKEAAEPAKEIPQKRKKKVSKKQSNKQKSAAAPISSPIKEESTIIKIENKVVKEEPRHEKEISIVEQKSIIALYSREDLLYAVPLLAKAYQMCIYLKHGRELQEDIPWEQIKYNEEKTLAYHKENYYKSYRFINKILRARETLKRNSKKMFLAKLGNYEENDVQEVIQSLEKQEREIIYLKHGKDLTEYNSLPYKNYYLNLYNQAMAHLKEKLQNSKKEITPKSKERRNSKNILEEVDRADLLEVVTKLNETQRTFLYLRHGKNLDTVLAWPPLPEGKNWNYYFYNYYNACHRVHVLINRKIKLAKGEQEVIRTVLNTYKREDLLYALPLIPEIIQKSIYLRHGKNLDRTIVWKEIEFPENRPISIYRQNYYRSYNFIDEVLEQRKFLKEQAQKTAITKLNEYSILEIKEAMQELSIEEQNVIYLKHRESLTEFKPWPNNHSLLYYNNMYSKAIIHLKDILRKKRKNNETPELPKNGNMAPASKKDLEIPSENGVEKSQKKKKHKQQVKQEVAKERNALTNQKDLLKEAKEINVKTELYNEFYELYGDLIGEEQLKSIVKESVDSYNQEENIDILYASKFKIESAILLLLANKYKENPESEEALAILIRINHIFTKKMKERYPHMDEGKIEWAIESALNSYEGNKTFSVELMKKLLK